MDSDGDRLNPRDSVTGVVAVSDVFIERDVTFATESGREVGVVLSWRTNAPAEVELWFPHADIAWYFARDLLQVARFLDADPGVLVCGDAAGWVDPENPGWMWLRLSNRTEQIVLRCDLADVIEFVDATTDVVRPCFDPKECRGCRECRPTVRAVNHLVSRLGVQ